MLTTCVISVDVEGMPIRNRGMDYSTITEGVPLLLDLFAEHNVNSTFFVTGDAAKNTANVLKDIDSGRHEIGCHAIGIASHASLKVASERISQHLRTAPIGFRAHRHKINSETLLSLYELGYKYDSSVVSSSRLFNRQFNPKAPKKPYHPSSNDIHTTGESPLLEIPISVLPAVKLPIGLGYMKAFGLKLYRWLLPKIEERTIVVYLHPYDLFKLPSARIDAALDFVLSQRGRANGFKTLQSFLKFVEEKFSPNFICARDLLDSKELVSRGGVGPSISTM